MTDDEVTALIDSLVGEIAGYMLGADRAEQERMARIVVLRVIRVVLGRVVGE